jgi:RNA polymerase sigma-70 factor, ECF subfamily
LKGFFSKGVTPSGAPEITGLLKAWGNGDQAALARLTAVIHSDLRRIARLYLRRERENHTLETTELVNEAYLRLLGGRTEGWQDRVHFFAVSAQIMRRILVDAARRRASQKRGGGVVYVSISSLSDGLAAREIGAAPVADLIALDDALLRLNDMDARKAKVIELRFFGGLSVEETAEALKVSPQTVMRDWRLARAWLARELAL